ncbi:DBH-like monooxygenase protein 2 homolog isoform X1 [Solea solea]|uniref:DBH-like monooxygenase protein 2 homolog isoform X1 n=1 Tax=Solea solea TaxID=90069 RepID=UPI00272CF2A0|nr:DBH-like monooxygenase protein 2 homolog isoform X1 [Solea solea]
MRSLLLLLCLSLARTKGAAASDYTLPFMVNLDQERKVCLKWGFDNQKGEIEFKLVVNTTGWIGFGFSPNGDMIGADIVIGGVNSNGSYFTDRHGIGKFKPVIDKLQSYTLLSLTEVDGQTSMWFRRSIRTCDDEDFDITDDPIKLIYAYGNTDNIEYHNNRRGTKEVNLLNYMPRTVLSNPSYLSATVVNITVPPVHTYYHCKVMKFSNINTKRHIYRIEPVIEHHDIVHHMLLYSCPSTVRVTYDKQCFQGDAGDACYGVVAAWAVGGGAIELPENAGIPVGGDGRDIYYRLEIHYNNPHLHAGRTDSSGLKLYHTAQLRQHDVGILTTGVLPFSSMVYSIPPKASQFLTYGVCNTSLITQSNDPVPDLQMFAVLLHTHLAGRKVRVAQYRDGKQIDFLAVDENYNFEMQTIVSLGEIKTIKQDDEIAVECTYNTVDRTNVTKMGIATTDEMCLAFLFYYPAIEITSCISHPITMSQSDTSNQTSTETWDHDTITQQENLLKTLPQLQIISNNEYNHTYYDNGIIREMMETPKPQSCHYSNASNRLYTSWLMDPAGIMLLLVWIALM